MPIPLKEWVLLDSKLRPIVRTNSTVYRAIVKTWMQCQDILSKVQTPLASFVYHPSFRTAASTTRFSKAGLDKLGNLCSESGIITEEQVLDDRQISRTTISI